MTTNMAQSPDCATSLLAYRSIKARAFAKLRGDNGIVFGGFGTCTSDFEESGLHRVAVGPSGDNINAGPEPLCPDAAVSH